MSGVPGTAMYSSTCSRPRLVARCRPSTSGSGRTPTHQISDRVATVTPVVSFTYPSPASAIDSLVRTSTPPQYPLGGPGQPRIQFGQQPGRGIHQHPPDLLPGQAGQRPGQPGG